MKKLKIETISNGSVHLLLDENGETAAICRADETSQEKAKLYAGQLTLAYNHTYGEGINPRAVPELLEAVEASLQMLEQTLNYRIVNKITGGNIFLITAIALSKKAIEKAQLLE